MKIWDHECWEKWDIPEKDFMLSLMSIQMKIDRIDKAMKDNVAYYYQTTKDSEDVLNQAIREAYIESVEKHISTLRKQIEILDEILDDI